MKIIFDHQIFCRQRYGGISRYFCELANHIADLHDHHVEIFAPLYLNEYLSKPFRVNLKGKKVSPMLGLGRPIAWAVDSILAYLSLKWRLDVDIFHETYFSPVDYCPAGARKVVTIHDMVYEIFRDEFPRQDRLRLMKARAVEQAEHVICVSENTRRDLIRILGVPEEKTSVVYHGYSFSLNPPRTHSSAGRPYILFVGKRDGYKNFDKLLRAYGRSERLRKELSLICFGGGNFSPAEEVAIKARGLSAGQVFQLAGGDDVLTNLYADAAVFIYPSLCEGFGIPLLEAMSLGCPVACSNTGSFPEVAGRAAEFFDPEEEEDIRRAIEKIVFSPDYRDTLVLTGRERVQKFSWDQCARDTLQVYGKLLR